MQHSQFAGSAHVLNGRKQKHQKSYFLCGQPQWFPDVDCFLQPIVYQRADLLFCTGAGTVKPPAMLQCRSPFPQLVGQIRAGETFPW